MMTEYIRDFTDKQKYKKEPNDSAVVKKVQ